MSKIIVTGGMGYIGSHTVVDLIENNYEVIILDNLSQSSIRVMDGIERITGIRPSFYHVDICDRAALESVFSKESSIEGIIHFAAYKYVDESVSNPLKYYRNNLEGLINILEMVERFYVKNFVFSSSCSIYGNISELPVSENSLKMPPESPYASSKWMGEQIIDDVKSVIPVNCISLRYFNPVGAHMSGHIGESPLNIPNNLVPRITATAIGAQEKLMVFGSHLPTRDGSCIRDYIHVSDIAEAHTLALKYLEKRQSLHTHTAINLGSGNGVSVLELIAAFEKVTGTPLKYELADSRPGDVIAIYSDNSLALQLLNWAPRRTIEDMMSSAWEWEKKNH